MYGITTSALKSRPPLPSGHTGGADRDNGPPIRSRRAVKVEHVSACS
jgi:hypothetical protein